MNTKRSREKTLVPTQSEEGGKFVSILKGIGVDVKLNSLKFADRNRSSIINQDEHVHIEFTCHDHNNSAHESEKEIDRITINLTVFSSGFEQMKKNVLDLNLSDVENQLLDKYIEILDVDHERKHVYVRIKKSSTQEEDEDQLENTSCFNYYLMGKIDQSQHAFLMDLSELTENRGTPFKNIDAIYNSCCLKSVKNRYYKTGKDGKTTFDHNTDCSIKRVLIGAFFISTTISGPSRYYNRYTPRNRRSISTGKHFSTVVSPRRKNEGVTISCHFSATYGMYDGLVSLGYYQMQLQVCHGFHVANRDILDSFRSHIVHCAAK